MSGSLCALCDPVAAGAGVAGASHLEALLAASRLLHAVVADDDPFLTSLIAAALSADGFAVREATDPVTAWHLVEAQIPDVVVTDLDFGTQMTGAELLHRTHARFPQVGLVLLTSHQDPQLVLGLDAHLPTKTRYQVKSALRSSGSLVATVRAALAATPSAALSSSPGIRTFAVTAAQAEVLRLLAQGASTRAIATRRGTSVRAAELMLQRLYQALELETGSEVEPRIAAVRLWQQGAVRLGA